MFQIITAERYEEIICSSEELSTSKDSSGTRLVRSNYRYHESTHFRNIGHTLTIAEAANILVGYPLVIPTGSIRRMRRRFSPPLARFVRISLAHIPTSSLCRFTESLRSDDRTEQHKATVYLFAYPRWQRLDLALIAAFTLLLLPLLAQSIVTGIYLTLPAVLILLSLTLPAVDNYLQLYRAHSLASLLDREIARRTGQDINNARNLPIMAAKNPGS